MRRFAIAASLIALAAVAETVHGRKELVLTNDALTMSVQRIDTSAECEITGNWSGVVTYEGLQGAVSGTWFTLSQRRTTTPTVSANGRSIFNIAGLLGFRARFSTATSGTAVVDCTIGTGAAPLSASGSGATTTTIAPTGGSLTAATATQVYAGATGTCGVDVTNLSTTIAMTCGETSAVSATVGTYVPPLATYSTPPSYGGTVFCYPASGTPAYSTQPWSCQ